MNFVLVLLLFGVAIVRGNEAGSFFEVDPDVRRLQRNLLQSEEKESTEAPTVHHETTEAPKKKGKFQPGEYLLGEIHHTSESQLSFTFCCHMFEYTLFFDGL